MAKEIRWVILLLALSLPTTSLVYAQVPNWPQFRGPNSSGIAASGCRPPVTFGPGEHLVWKTALPSGHSSPCIWGDCIFVTGYEKENQTFSVYCLRRPDGGVEWQRSIQVEAVEKIHPISHLATATPATDGERVYVYFGSFGMLCYDFAGQEVWKRKLPIPQTAFGTGTSPVVTGEMILLNRDEKKQPMLIGLDRLTGEILWESTVPPDTQRENYRGSYATPVRWNNEWVLHRYKEIVAYSDTGERQWALPATTGGASTPAVGDDALYVGTWHNLGEAELQVDLPDFAEFAAIHDQDTDGEISRNELPADQMIARRPEATPGTKGADIRFGSWLFRAFDADSNGVLSPTEWEAGRQDLYRERREHGLVALRRSQAQEPPRVIWLENKSAAEVPSPLYYDDLIYMIKNGGIVSCLEAESGELQYRERLGARGSYYASPIVAGNKVYAASEQGIVVVFQCGKSLEILARNDLGENIYATPGVVEDRIYIRTTGHLFCFGE